MLATIFFDHQVKDATPKVPPDHQSHAFSGIFILAHKSFWQLFFFGGGGGERVDQSHS